MRVSCLFILFLIPLFSIGQIPKGHFIDADDSGEKGYVIKPFKQKKEGIYHYAILTELPFENNCSSNNSEEEQIKCSEDKLRELIQENLEINKDYKGNIYVYLTVSENAEIENIKIKSYPRSEEIESIVKIAVEKIKVKPAKYKNKVVKARLWTNFKV